MPIHLLRLAFVGVLAVAFAPAALAMGSEPPAATQDTKAPACKEKDKSKCTADKPAAAPCHETDKTKCHPGKQSFLDDYHAAVALIEAGRYEEAMAAMKALDDGTSADVVNYIGYIHRKMGHMAEAQMYYEAALHMKPDLPGALEYYGEWYCMMGNVARARENLDRLRTLYGTQTKEYAALAQMIEETEAKAKS